MGEARGWMRVWLPGILGGPLTAHKIQFWRNWRRLLGGGGVNMTIRWKFTLPTNFHRHEASSIFTLNLLNEFKEV